MKGVRYIFSLFLKFINTNTVSISEMNQNGNGDTSLVKRLLDVEGLEGRKNDLLYHPPLNTSAGSKVVFFGGDCQDYPERMLTHRDNRRHVKWNLEQVAKILHTKFPTSDIYIIRPSRMHLGTFSCFDNFVKSNDVGVPSHSYIVDSLKHLQKLLQNVNVPLDDKSTEQCSIELPLVLIGFSKGCVVLNQFLYSLKESYDSKDSELESFIRSIETMYWLDGGHSGGSNTWMTDKVLLKHLTSRNVNVRIHVTPYQVRCRLRPWIGKEEKIFRETLQRLNVNIIRTMHFEDEESCLENHFRLLEVF